MIKAHFTIPFKDFCLETHLDLPSQGVTAIFGPSGCGKTTLLRCIAGLEKKAYGLCQISEVVWQDSSRNFYLPTYKRSLGYVFQEASLFPHLNVWKNLNFGRQRVKALKDKQGLETAIDLLGIGHLLERYPEKLSGGEKQRVAIARALALEPQILLMDEPLAALDYQRKQEILPYLSRLQTSLAIPILYVTHAPQEVTRLANYLVVLEAGKVMIADQLQSALTRLDSPLALSRQAATVLETTVCHQRPDVKLTQVGTGSLTLNLVYQPELAIGSPLRLRIYARDVSLSVLEPQPSSILNVLPATIKDLVQDTEGRTIVQLLIGEQLLLAQITSYSAQLLKLAVNMPIFAQIKTTAML